MDGIRQLLFLCCKGRFSCVTTFFHAVVSVFLPKTWLLYLLLYFPSGFSRYVLPKLVTYEFVLGRCLSYRGR